MQRAEPEGQRRRLGQDFRAGWRAGRVERPARATGEGPFPLNCRRLFSELRSVSARACERPGRLCNVDHRGPDCLWPCRLRDTSRTRALGQRRRRHDRLLAFKEVLHGWLRALTWLEMSSALVIGVAARIVLPFLPSGPVDSWRLFDLQALWLLTLVIACTRLEDMWLCACWACGGGLPLRHRPEAVSRRWPLRLISQAGQGRMKSPLPAQQPASARQQPPVLPALVFSRR